MEQIGQFFMCTAHQLKQSDYKKICGLMNKMAFMTLNQIFYLTVLPNRPIEKFFGQMSDKISAKYDQVIRTTKSNSEKTIKELEVQLRSGWGGIRTCHRKHVAPWFASR